MGFRSFDFNLVFMIIYFNETELDISVNDDSYRYRVIRGEHSLTLYYSLAQHVEIPVGAYCEFEGEQYTLERPENFRMLNTRNFEYTLVMNSEQSKLSKYKFKDTTSGRLKFSLTAKAQDHLKMLVDNLNMRETGWNVGSYLESTEKVISYNHAYCLDALNQMADEFETEWEIVGKTIHLHKVEYNKDAPLPLSYGRGNGFKSGIGRSVGDDRPVEILYVQGGERNIDASKYGSRELLLPKNKALVYEGRSYVSDENGFSIRRGDKGLQSGAEGSLDCSHIYPSRVGTVSTVTIVDANKHFHDFMDNSIPADLNFAECLVGGESMTVIFQTGMLVGKEFEVKYFHDGRRFEIVPQEADGRTMPDNVFKAAIGDSYAVFGMMLPAAYISNDVTETGASWDMFREAVKYMYENEDHKFTFTGELDGIWAKRDWANIGGKIKLGGYILFSDNQFQPDGVLIRIVGIKDYINNPHSPVIELSNNVVGGSLISELRKIESNEVVVDTNYKNALSFTKRRFRDSMETIHMIENALFDHFTDSIKPVAVQTMAMLVGDEGLQFRFVNNKNNPIEIAHNVSYSQTAKILTSPAGIIQHMTLGINSLSSVHQVSEYKFWTLPEFTSAYLGDGTKKYYLYAKVGKTTAVGEYMLSETAIGMEDNTDYYHLLMGVLNSEYEGERSYSSLYGFSEVLPGQMTTNKVVSSDGKNFIDFLNNAARIGNTNTYLDFNTSGDGLLKLKGTIVQSQSGDEQPLGCFRGEYNSSYTYYQGDEVTYNGSTFMYTYSTQSTGIAPSDVIRWKMTAARSTRYIDAYKVGVTKPATPTGSVIPPSGWSTTPLEHSETESLWFSQTTIDAYDNIGTWSEPIKLNGNDGTDMEYIYKRTTTDSVPVTPTTSQTDDYVPDGWTDQPAGVDISNMYEWVSVRSKEYGVWSTYSAPVLWAKWGEKGMDGDGYEYIYRRTVTDTAPTTPSTSSQEDDVIPTGWTDNPIGTDYVNMYEWVSVRKKENGIWGTFSVPALWAKYGRNGTRYVDVYKIATVQPNTPTGSVIPPSGWSTTPLEHSETESLWFSQTTIEENGDIGTWSAPIKLNGSDGKDVEYIYKRTTTDTAPTTPTTSQTDDYVPAGWTDQPTGVSISNMYEFCCVRTKEYGVWSAYSAPVLWAKYGEKGMDGDGYEYIYRRTVTDTAPTTPTTSQTDDYVPTGWTDNPAGTNENNMYEWVSVRKKENGVWGTFSVPALWAKYGKNGVTTYTWIKYANDANGGGISNSPEGKLYIGFAYNKTTATESNTASDYTWSLIKGTDGVPGAPGADGQSLYTWIKYSDNSDGTGMYDVPSSNTLYIGIAVNKTTPTESTNKADYAWSKFKGDQGVPGATTYTWIKYANDANGGGMSNSPAGKLYIGFAYNKTTATESDTASDYTWSLIKGTDGVPGAPGADGVTTYTWIKYSDNPDGTGMYDTPSSNTLYIGIAVNKTTATESTNKADYTWSKFKGDQGVPGATTYTWIKYANDANGGGMSNDPDGKKYIGFAYNKTTATESNTASDYTWSLIKGTDGVPGAPGADGVTTYTWIKYSDNSDGTGMYDVPTSNTLYIGIAVNKTTATESTNKADYTWSKFKGDAGVAGTNGVNGQDGGYFEYRYAKNGSTTAPPSLANTAAEPQGWSTTLPSVGELEYLWFTIAKKSATGTLLQNWGTPVRTNGERGADGVPGEKGADGVTTYTWIKYANDANGGGMSNDPDGKKYIGFAYNKTTGTESNTASDYTWSLIKGTDGVPGAPGADGVTTYTWIKYSDNPDGTGMYDTPSSNTLYIGIAVNKTTSVESNNWSDYTWSLFKGNKGDKGDKGDAGTAGVSPALVYRGEYSSSETYYGRATRVDAVKYNDTYYVARVDAGSVKAFEATVRVLFSGADFLEYNDPDIAKISFISGNGTLHITDNDLAITNTNSKDNIANKLYNTLLTSNVITDKFTIQLESDTVRIKGKDLVASMQIDENNGLYGYLVTIIYNPSGATTGSFSGKIPTNTDYWNPFGATFTSVATNLLLSENAWIADWIIKNGKISSQAKYGAGFMAQSKTQFDGGTGEISLATDREIYIPGLGTSLTSIQTTIIAPDDITIQTEEYATVIDSGSVYAGVEKSKLDNVKNKYGGYFTKLFANGLYLPVKSLSGSSGYTLKDNDVILYNRSSSSATIKLTSASEGRIVFILSRGGNVIVQVGTASFLFDHFNNSVDSITYTTAGELIILISFGVGWSANYTRE
jgi:hypothetical protein